MTGSTAGASVAGVGGSSVLAGAGGSSAMAGAGAAGSSATAGAWPTADLGAAGPFMSMTVMNSGPSNGYMLFFPKELGRDGLKHPIVTWGNGAGSTPGGYTLLPRLATHGFVVIASNSSSVTGALLKGGIDWLITENGREGSMFKDKLDPNQVAAMGYSLGSLATFDTAADARIKTTVHISGGSMNKSVVANLHGPAAFYCGNDSDIAYSNCESDFAMTKVPTIYANFPGGHGGVIGAQAAQISKATVGWLRWRLMGDKTLDAMFIGPDCTLCKDSAWDKVQQKSLDVAPP
jgi:dienelactone hydrolase